MTREQLLEVIPDNVKLAVQGYQLHRVMSQMTGLSAFSIEKVSEYLGGMAAARQARWRPVWDGLRALQKLE